MCANFGYSVIAIFVSVDQFLSRFYPVKQKQNSVMLALYTRLVQQWISPHSKTSDTRQAKAAFWLFYFSGGGGGGGGGRFQQLLWNNYSTRACWIWDDYLQLGATSLVGYLPFNYHTHLRNRSFSLSGNENKSKTIEWITSRNCNVVGNK